MTGAVVFDCDGVLVDSEPHSVVAWLAVLSSLGHPAGASDVDGCVGLGFEQTREALASLGDLPPAHDLWPLLLEQLGRSFAAGLERFEDAVEVLEACESAGIPVAVVSASPRGRLDLTLSSAGLEHRFPVSVAGDEVPSGKPAPDGYLAAAEGLSIPPAECLAIEDTVTGVAAAVAAGMQVVGVDRRGDPEGLAAAGASRVMPRLGPGVLG